MTANKDPSIVKLISEFQQLQHTARTLADVANGIKANPKLLKEVCLALGRSDFTFPGSSPSVRRFTLSDVPRLSHTFKDRNFLDKYMVPYQMFSTVLYNTDITIDLELIFRNIPELGLSCDNLAKPHYTGGAHEQKLFFSPAKWPFIASHLIFNVYTNARLKRDAADMLLNDFYPGINREQLTNILGSGIFENKGEFCDWLMANTAPSSVEQVDTAILNNLDL